MQLDLISLLPGQKQMEYHPRQKSNQSYFKNYTKKSIYTTKQPRYLKSVLFQNYIKKTFKTFKSGIVVMVGWWQTMECMVLILFSSYMGRIKLLHHGAPMRRPNISTPPPTTNQV